ncbi:XdhC family protein [Hansschlegelia quercus]|uniref:XdhC family protein n=1 Tax=Hansschlegelia quercus TaxID=2528245 RepID=A0A4Q9GKX0_9HYPH|nr:XdhC family protein [Hansschlegelia quercus]TBN54862.1 XdhC family protein [Hansschlegelia quercus]
MRLDLLAELNAVRDARRAACIVTELASGDQRLVIEPEASDPFAEKIRNAFASGKSTTAESIDGKAVFLNVHVPSPRLVVLGAVHVSQTLAPMAATLGYEVTVLDPRTAFAAPERFPGVDLVAEWPDVALPRLGLDPFTAFAALTHDPKIDDPGLSAALAAGCFYVGALGSRKTHAARRDRLAATGVKAADFDRIRAPIGLPIGAASPAEIAVSIMAEITAALRKPEIRA